MLKELSLRFATVKESSLPAEDRELYEYFMSTYKSSRKSGGRPPLKPTRRAAGTSKT
jgi:hypothetical protein